MGATNSQVKLFARTKGLPTCSTCGGSRVIRVECSACYGSGGAGLGYSCCGGQGCGACTPEPVCETCNGEREIEDECVDCIDDAAPQIETSVTHAATSRERTNMTTEEAFLQIANASLPTSAVLSNRVIAIVQRAMDISIELTTFEAELRSICAKFADCAAGPEEQKAETLRTWRQMADFIGQAVATLDGRVPLRPRQLEVKTNTQPL